MEHLVAILVPIACGCVLPIMIIWFSIRKQMNDTNKRTQIVLAAIEKNPEMDVEELMKLPGIGKKIANLIVGEIYGTPALVVDTHCKRVMKRIGITKNDDPLKVEADCCKVFPEDSWIRLGHMAVDLGRTYCIARAPKCDICPLMKICGRKI